MFNIFPGLKFLMVSGIYNPFPWNVQCGVRGEKWPDLTAFLVNKHDARTVHFSSPAECLLVNANFRERHLPSILAFATRGSSI